MRAYAFCVCVLVLPFFYRQPLGTNTPAVQHLSTHTLSSCLVFHLGAFRSSMVFVNIYEHLYIYMSVQYIYYTAPVYMYNYTYLFVYSCNMCVLSWQDNVSGTPGFWNHPDGCHAHTRHTTQPSIGFQRSVQPQLVNLLQRRGSM